MAKPDDDAPPSLLSITVAGSPQPWAACGFAVRRERALVGSVEMRFGGSYAHGPLSAAFAGLLDAEPDGLPFGAADGEPPGGDGHEHPLGVLRLDHLVAFTADLDRTVAALRGAGFDLRRVREEPTPAGAPRQAFFRIGEPILEVVQEPDDVVAERGAARPAKLWGMAFAVRDMDHAATVLGPRLGTPRPAVQQGRTIATLRRDAGLPVPVALITEREP
jgi:hypothetical protein